MAKIKEEKAEKLEPAQADIARYLKFCEENPQYKVGGVYVSPRERYLIANCWAVFKSGEIRYVEPKEWEYVGKLEFERQKKLPCYSPAKEYWDDIKSKIKIMDKRAEYMKSLQEEFEAPF